MASSKESDNAIDGQNQKNPSFNWPGRRRADEVAEAAEKRALQGLERLRQKPPAEQGEAPDARARELGELRGLIFEATQQLRDAIKIEANEIARIIQSEQETMKHAIKSLQEMTSELRAAATAEAKSGGHAEQLPAATVDTRRVSHFEHPSPPLEYRVDLNKASHADLCTIGMSETQASRVIRHRDRSGGFESVSELDHVPGFLPAARAQLYQRVSVRRRKEEASKPTKREVQTRT